MNRAKSLTRATMLLGGAVVLVMALAATAAGAEDRAAGGKSNSPGVGGPQATGQGVGEAEQVRKVVPAQRVQPPAADVAPQSRRVGGPTVKVRVIGGAQPGSKPQVTSQGRAGIGPIRKGGPGAASNLPGLRLGKRGMENRAAAGRSIRPADRTGHQGGKVSPGVAPATGRKTTQKQAEVSPAPVSAKPRRD